jgi:hypothetical protein
MDKRGVAVVGFLVVALAVVVVGAIVISNSSNNVAGTGESITGWEVKNDCVKETVYFDQDGDGFGNASHKSETCYRNEKLVLNGDDCDDNDAGINPDAEEICGNGVDEDCDGVKDVCIPINNHIENPGFESGTKGWEFSNTGNGTAEDYSFRAHTGSKSLRIRNYAFAIQRPDVLYGADGQTFYLSFWAKIEQDWPATNPVAYIQGSETWQAPDEFRVDIDTSITDPRGFSNWKKYTLTFTLPEDDGDENYHLTLGSDPNNEGGIFFDDVVLEKIVPGPDLTLEVRRLPSEYLLNRLAYFFTVKNIGSVSVASGTSISICRESNLNVEGCEGTYKITLDEDLEPGETISSNHYLRILSLANGDQPFNRDVSSDYNEEDLGALIDKGEGEYIFPEINIEYFEVDSANEVAELDEGNNRFSFVGSDRSDKLYPPSTIKSCGQTDYKPGGSKAYKDKYGLDFCGDYRQFTYHTGDIRVSSWYLRHDTDTNNIIQDKYLTLIDNTKTDTVFQFFKDNYLTLDSYDYNGINYPVYIGKSNGEVPNSETYFAAWLVTNTPNQHQIRIIPCNQIGSSSSSCSSIVSDFVVREYLECGAGNNNWDIVLDPVQNCPEAPSGASSSEASQDSSKTGGHNGIVEIGEP